MSRQLCQLAIWLALVGRCYQRISGVDIATTRYPGYHKVTVYIALLLLIHSNLPAEDSAGCYFLTPPGSLFQFQFIHRCNAKATIHMDDFTRDPASQIRTKEGGRITDIFNGNCAANGGDGFTVR